MTLRPMSALLVVFLAACSTPEPQSPAYAPVAPSPAAVPAPVGPSGLGDQPTDIAPSGMSAAPALQPGCNTVDGVTLCDAPYDPDADDTRYTN